MTIDNKTITLKRVKELVKYGEMIHVKVTAEWNDYYQQMVINIRDLQFKEYVHAVLYLQEIQRQNEVHTEYLVV